MKPTFILLHTECVNQCRDSVCHIILVPVVNGRRDDTIEYIVNPHATFDFVMSGITEEQLAAAPGLEQEWTDIQCLLETSGDIVCSAEGYSARALSGTLARLGIKAPKYAFCNAKAICRRSMSEPSYSLDYLSGVRFGDYVAETAPRARIAVNAACPGVSIKVMFLPSPSVTVYAPMLWVMPPASPLVTLVLRMASSSEVLPWST